MHIKGCIDSYSNGIVNGWLVTDNEKPVSIVIDGDTVTDINELFLRQDILDLGITDKAAGFSIDVTEFLNSKVGSITIKLAQGDLIIASYEAYIPSKVNIIKNDYLALQDQNSITDWSIATNHRVGLSLANFIAPKGIKHASGYYTRFSFGDINNTRHQLFLTPSLNFDNCQAKTLKLAVVGKASHDSHLHLVLTDKSGQRVLNEPILLTHKWQHLVVELEEEYVEGLLSAELDLSFTIKHHGRRFIDIAMIQLSEQLLEPIEQTATPEETDFTTNNIIKNGDLKSWPNGIVFNQLKRGQELAENWLLEMNKANQGKVAVAAISDNSQNDPLGATITSQFGLRVRSKELDGYARLIIPFAKQSLNEINYQFELDIEATGLGKKVTLPRIYIIARDAHNDAVIYNIVRKRVVSNREKISLNIDAIEINKMLNSSLAMPSLTLAIDLPNDNDISVYGVSLIAKSNNEKSQLVETESITPSSLRFEDKSITAQLSVLKGLDAWSSEKAIKPENKQNLIKHDNEITLKSNNEFVAHISALTPHKLTRPSREFPFVDIIVPVYNACDDVLLCLSSLIEKTDLLHRVIVINDGQDERTAIMLDAFNSSYNHLEVITNPENIGYTRSVNKGIGHSNADWVVVLNSDTIVSEGWLGKLMNCALSQDNVGMVGALSNAASWQSVPKVHDASGDWHLNPLPKNMTIDDVANKIAELSQRDYPEVGVINGFCQLINTRMLDNIGLLDDVAFPIGYGEENDMCARAVKGGYTLLIADDTYVFHAKSKSFGHTKRKELAKQGSAALKKKHPDVDWGDVTKRIFEHPSLVELRKQLAVSLAE
ncbi:glycosyltransferase family 2 protein [Pseudoalteromonas sp. Angola-7]|uniref:glycosyltransferase family 2 protein n=1 Tax=Pseudoalteromonas sp. Angola-7 TaxID=3025336 RepID=UPI002358DE03|nr:glycosyltransferase [Pseudoalteromonas sp. Angola-7]MDC9529650.1 glycosyltransferase [Pseudoalteromonas sp. Angola-7]